jgi:hypothetical protein
LALSLQRTVAHAFEYGSLLSERKRPPTRWPQSRLKAQYPRPRNPKGRAHNPNYRIATGTLICVKAVSTPNTLLATVRSDRACQVWHRHTGTACLVDPRHAGTACAHLTGQISKSRRVQSLPNLTEETVSAADYARLVIFRAGHRITDGDAWITATDRTAKSRRREAASQAADWISPVNAVC